MSQPELTHQILKWVMISIASGAGIGMILGLCLLVRHHFSPKFRSVVVPDDFLGKTAVVVLPFGFSQTGKVRIAFNDQTFDQQARSYDDTVYRMGDLVLVVDIDERGVWVIADWSREFISTEAS